MVAAVSFNGGNSWQSVVLPGFSLASGGVYPHASDPWISFAPNGDVYYCAIGFDTPNNSPNAVLVSKSIDGGLSWTSPIAIASESGSALNDKACITADPNDGRFAYACWTHFQGGHAPAQFSRTTDGGQTWEPSRVIFDPGSNNTAETFQILTLPNGNLVNVFTQQIRKSSSGGTDHFDFKISLIRSTDHGQTWQSIPTPVADILPINDMVQIPGARGVANPDGGIGIDAQSWFFNVAMDPNNGNLYVVWQDARFSNFQYNSIAFAMSSDGGQTWSTPIQVNQTPNNVLAGNRQAILPSVAVNQDGIVAVTYYDFRNNTPDPGVPTDLWMAHAHPADGLTNPASWSSENRMTPTSFNIENAPVRNGYFLGDYQGFVAPSHNFGAFFATTQGTGSTSIFYRDPLPAEDEPPAGGTATKADTTALRGASLSNHFEFYFGNGGSDNSGIGSFSRRFGESLL